MLTFPADPWVTAFNGDVPQDIDAVVPAMVERIMSERGAPRDIDLARQFVRTALPAGRVLVYGAGTHTAALLESLRANPRLTLVGVIDKSAGTFRDFYGLPVCSPDQAVGMGDVDYILLSHEFRESQMRSALLDRGYPAERIRTVYADPQYCEQAFAASLDVLPPEGQRADNVILDFARGGQTLIEERDLAMVLPPGDTIKLSFGRFPDTYEKIYQTYSLRQSFHLVREALARLRPRLVYVRSFIEDNVASFLVKHLFPDVTLVHELYDVCVTVERDYLTGVMGHDANSIRMSLIGELFSGRHCRMVISKRQGEYWDRIVEGFSVRPLCYFPQVFPPPPEPLDGVQGRPLRIVHAANLPMPNNVPVDTIRGLFPFLRAALPGLDVRFDLYNGVHRNPAQDGSFQWYRDLVATIPGMSYNCGLAYGELVARMREYDYGWLCFPRDSNDFIEDFLVVGNKLTGYLSAGLPVIMDDGWHYMAGLIREFDAGLVLPMTDPETAAMLLRNLDPVRHRKGARRLAQWMLDNNREVLAQLAEVVTEARS